MSKMAAIDFAVRQQILDDKKVAVIDYNERMGPAQAPAAAPAAPAAAPAAPAAAPAGPAAAPAAPAAAPAPVTFLGYNASELAIFLFKVSNRLKLDVPPLIFAWSNIDLQNCPDMTVGALEVYISAHTNPTT